MCAMPRDANPERDPPKPGVRAPGVRLPVGKLPFVGVRRDGQLGFWVIPPQDEGVDLRHMGRTYAAWFILYAEANGASAARDLMDRIEREMPSRYPALDRAFLDAVTGAGLMARLAAA